MESREYESGGNGSNGGYSSDSNPVGVGVGLKSEWEITLKDAKTGEIKQQIPWHKNTILDAGLNFLLTWNYGFTYYWPNLPHPSYTPFGYIAVGTGNTAPAVTDIVMERRLQTYVSSQIGILPKRTMRSSEAAGDT